MPRSSSRSHSRPTVDPATAVLGQPLAPGLPRRDRRPIPRAEQLDELRPRRFLEALDEPLAEQLERRRVCHLGRVARHAEGTCRRARHTGGHARVVQPVDEQANGSLGRGADCLACGAAPERVITAAGIAPRRPAAWRMTVVMMWPSPTLVDEPPACERGHIPIAARSRACIWAV